MNKKELKQYQKKLINLKKEILDDLSFSSDDENNTGNFSISHHSTHLTDIADETLQRQNHISLNKHLVKTLKEIDFSLLKIEKGRYGICENCHNKIPKKRLNAEPYARFCIDCRQISEKL
ncbi:MAG: TraR/DksA family transcriptional regulator [Candidatus Hydrogenedentota bacterium]